MSGERRARHRWCGAECKGCDTVRLRGLWDREGRYQAKRIWWYSVDGGASWIAKAPPCASPIGVRVAPELEAKAG